MFCGCASYSSYSEFKLRLNSAWTTDITMDRLTPPAQRPSLHRLRSLAILNSALCVYRYLIHLAMASQPTPQEGGLQTGRAQWNTKEIDGLIVFLREQSQVSGSSSFKTTTFQAAALHIAEFWSSGPKKTAQMCKGKWTMV